MPAIPHNPPSVPAPVGGYSHGVEITTPGRFLFLSGQIPESAAQRIPADFRDQCHLVWQHLLAVLQSADMNLDHLVKVTTFLTDRSQVTINGEVRRQYLGTRKPALTVIIAQTLQPEWHLEIEATAFRSLP